jgi:hypothetical protein
VKKVAAKKKKSSSKVVKIMLSDYQIRKLEKDLTVTASGNNGMLYTLRVY